VVTVIDVDVSDHRALVRVITRLYRRRCLRRDRDVAVMMLIPFVTHFLKFLIYVAQSEAVRFILLLEITFHSCGHRFGSSWEPCWFDPGQSCGGTSFPDRSF
jgi:hypothetical protein